MPIAVVPLSECHVEAAVRLVQTRLDVLREDVPALSTACGSPDTLAERLARLAGQGPGVAALDGGRLVGFLGAFPIRYGGRPSMLSPEWANGATPRDARRIWEALYTEAAREWAVGGAETHLVALLAHDTVAALALSWLGFGRVVCDAVRAADPVGERSTSWRVRQATASDAGLVSDFDRRLHRHLESSPVFLIPDEDEDEAWWRERLADSARAVWLAEGSAGPVGYLIQGPASDHACDLIVDPGTSSITGAFVASGARTAGVATALLARAADWARKQGYVRIAVDFETANVPAARFWLRHFQPVVVSWARTIRRSDTRND